jgi:hypothetical protein
MALGAIIGGASSILGGIFGASSARDQAREQKRIQREQVISTYNQQLANYNFQNAESQMAFDFANAKAKHDFNLSKALATQEWQTMQALDQANFVIESTNSLMRTRGARAAQELDWQFAQTMQEAEFRSEMRSYEMSERDFAAQTQLIGKSLQAGYEVEQIKLAAAKMQIADQAEAARMEAAQGQATVAASGRVGRSVARLQGDAMQQLNRDIGTLGINMAFSIRDTQASMQNIGLQGESEFNNALSNRMLKPMDLINIPRPVPTPDNFMPQPFNIPKPLQATGAMKPMLPGKPMQGPAPVMGSMVPSAGSGAAGILLQGLASGAGQIYSGVQAFRSPQQSIQTN